MKHGFLDKTLDTRSSNGRDDELLSELRFVDADGTLYKSPIGALTDGGSTPRIAWLIPGFEPFGRHWFDWVQHDSGYRGTLMVFREGEWVPARLSQLQCDQLLRRSLALRGMGEKTRWVVYRALRLDGHKHYRPAP